MCVCVGAYVSMCMHGGRMHMCEVHVQSSVYMKSQ